MSTSGPGQQRHGVMPDQTVEGWLGQVGMGQYLTLFVENQVRPEDLRMLNDEFLKDIGIQSVQHRKKILAAPKPLIKERPKKMPRVKAKSSFNLQIINMYWLAPFCAGLCCFIAEICFIAVGLPTIQSASIFGTSALLGTVTVFFSLLGTTKNVPDSKSIGGEILALTFRLAIYIAFIAFFFNAFELETKTFRNMMLSWSIFVGLPMVFLRKLFLKSMPHIFGIALIMSLLFTTWEVFLFSTIHNFNFMGTIAQQNDAWAFTLLALIRSLSVFLFYTRGALDIRHLYSQQEAT